MGEGGASAGSGDRKSGAVSGSIEWWHLWSCGDTGCRELVVLSG